jgi:hypothetical protein
LWPIHAFWILSFSRALPKWSQRMIVIRLYNVVKTAYVSIVRIRFYRARMFTKSSLRWTPHTFENINSQGLLDSLKLPPTFVHESPVQLILEFTTEVWQVHVDQVQRILENQKVINLKVRCAISGISQWKPVIQFGFKFNRM